MKAIRRINTKVKSAAKNIRKLGMRFAADRLRTILGLSVIALAPLFATAAPDIDTHDSIVPEKPLPETTVGFAGIGPVVAGSVTYRDLPSKAQKFLERNCDGHAVVKLDKQYASGSYNLLLADGIDINFDAKGNVMAIEAPEGYCLAPNLLKAVIPGKLFHLLDHNGFKESVSAMHRDRAGYRLDIADPVFDQISYQTSGILTMIAQK